MKSLRFANTDLQKRLVASLAQLPFAVTVGDDGSVSCTDDQWPSVNDLAHLVRDSCFRWYFLCPKSDESAREVHEHLLANGLRHEVEYHGSEVVFLLPRDEQEKHLPPGEGYTGPDRCSFCGAEPYDRQSFFVANDSAICDDCVRTAYGELNTSDDV